MWSRDGQGRRKERKEEEEEEEREVELREEKPRGWGAPGLGGEVGTGSGHPVRFAELALWMPLE